MNPNAYHDAAALREAGVHLTPYDVPTYPTTAEVNKLKRQIQRGIEMPDGSVVAHDAPMVEALSRGWVDNDAMIPQFRSPRYRATRAGMTATVSGLHFVTELQTNPFNPRPNTKLDIPGIDPLGRVPMAWAPTDRKADPDNDARMLVEIENRDELNSRVLESERHILAEQTNLADLISREGVEEELLAIIVRYTTEDLAHELAPTTIDGNSRLAIARTVYRQWITKHLDEILGVVKSSRPRVALSRLLERMRDGLLPLEQNDPLALRHLQKAVRAAIENNSTEEVLRQELYAVANTFVVPVTMIVAFSPASPEETVLDAADLMMRNMHHPSRAAKTWDQASGHAEVRDEVVAKLYDTGVLTLGEVLYLGPRYEEACETHGQDSAPDRRAFAAVDLINGNNDLGHQARVLVREAVGCGSVVPRALRAQIITAILTEQLRNVNAQVRKSFESTMHDVLDTKRYGSVKHTPWNSKDDAAELLSAAMKDFDNGYTVDNSGAIKELALKGGIALAALGHLTRTYGALAHEMPRPYQVLDNMITDTAKDGLGFRVLSDAVAAWRSATPLPEYDVEKRKPIPGSAPMRPTTLARLFPNPDTSFEAGDTAESLLLKMQKVLADKFDPLMVGLLKLPEVRREGAPADTVQEVLDIIDPASAKLKLQAAKYEEFHTIDVDDADQAGVSLAGDTKDDE